LFQAPSLDPLPPFLLVRDFICVVEDSEVSLHA
jgi:hypothetical protein